jgi:hypothetical protein
LTRLTRSLAGTWQFELDPTGSLTPATLAPDRQIPVPLPWQAAFPDLQQYSGYAWYRTTIDLTDEWLGGEVLLRFGAVDYWCQVYVNGHLAGQHEGGYTPILLPIRRYVQAGTNTLIVRVYDSAQTGMEIPRWPSYPPVSSPPGPPFDANHVPHGKQEWYINVGGIWQDVTLTAVPAAYIDQVQVIPDIHTGEAQVTVELAGDLQAAADGHIQVRIHDEHTAADSVVPVRGDGGVYTATVRIAQPRLWSGDDPHLYTATVHLQSDGAADTLAVRFGYREIRTANGQILLNGEPLFLLCALDQDLYPETIYTVPSEEYLRDQFTKAKALGLNSLRCHIKPADPRYLDLADEMGLLIWAEIPSWRTFYPKGTIHPNLLTLDDTIKQRAETLLEEMIRRDMNHPSIVIWTIINEDWGTALPLSADDRRWVREMYHRCKALDNTRLVVDNSACPHPWGPNIHVESDLDDFHFYANIPDQGNGFLQTVEQFALRPIWTYSSHGDSRRSGQEPLVISEFGNWGLPTLGPLRAATRGADPAWFQLGPWWSPWDGEAGWPRGVEERFAEFGLTRIWPDYDSFARASQWHQFYALQFEIGAMRRQPTLQGYVITEFTDAYWESNGLLDFTRQPKVFQDRFAEINAPDVIVASPAAYAGWDDRPLSVPIHLAHWSSADWRGARLRWQIEEVGEPQETRVPVLKRGAVVALPPLAVALPTVAAAQTVTLRLWLEGDDGTVLTRNRIDLLVLPAAARAPRYQDLLAVIAPGTDEESASDLAPAAPQPPELPGASRAATMAEVTDEPRLPARSLAHRLGALGYRTTTQLPAGRGLAVSTYPTAALLDWVRAGGDLLFISQGPTPFFWVQRRGGTYGGSWMTSFSWLDPAIHPRLAVQNPLSLPYAAVIPHGTILGLPVSDPAAQPDLLAGQISGWVQQPAIHTVQFRYGQGRVLMTTLALEEGLADPVGTAIFHDLIEYLHSDRCAPALTANY